MCSFLTSWHYELAVDFVLEKTSRELKSKSSFSFVTWRGHQKVGSTFEQTLRGLNPYLAPISNQIFLKLNVFLLDLQNCCPCLHQRGEFYTKGITPHLSVDLLVLRQLNLTKGSSKSTIGRPNSHIAKAILGNLELHATQRPKSAVGGQRDIRQTVVAQLSETQVSFSFLVISASCIEKRYRFLFQGCFLIIEWHQSPPSLGLGQSQMCASSSMRQKRGKAA